MLKRLGPVALCLVMALSWVPFHAQELQPDHRQRVDDAIPRQAPARPKKPRRLLVTNLSVRNGKPFVSTSAAAVPVANYALERMGKVTGAFEVVFSDDVEMFRPAALSRFDAICFHNSLGVLFDDPALRASLSRPITGSVSWAICIWGTLAAQVRLAFANLSPGHP
jgi:hypothetical protein